MSSRITLVEAPDRTVIQIDDHCLVQSLGRLADDCYYSVEKLAEALGLSLRAIHRLFMRDMMMNPKQWMIYTKYRAAIKLLHTSMTITQISQRLHYRRASSFSRDFKDWTGTTPTEYRQTFPMSDDEITFLNLPHDRTQSIASGLQHA